MVRFNEEKKANEIALIEIFKSLDGEGFHAGQPTVFVRTLGCNLRCDWCDSKYTFTEASYKETYKKDLMWMTADEIIEYVSSLEAGWEWKSICLTGGEPLLEENKEFMTELIGKMIKLDYAVNVETNGSIDYKYWRDTFPIPDEIRGDLYGNRKGMMTLITDWKLPSSKMNKLMKWDNIRGVLTPFDLIKCVITDSSEDWREFERVCKSAKNAKIYLSPCFGKVTLPNMWNWVADHPEYKITLQLQEHKIFFDPDKIGV